MRDETIASLQPEAGSGPARGETPVPTTGVALLWKWARGSELLLLSGTPVFAFLLSTTVLDLRRFAIFAAGTLALGAHVMTLNTLFGQRTWASDREVMDFPLGPEEWRPRQIEVLSLAFLAAACGLLAFLSLKAAATGLAIALLWMLYAHPRIRLKGRAPLDSVIHLAAGFAHFSLGSLASGGTWPAGRPLAWATGLTAVFVGGHLHHVVKDLDADRAAGMKTIGIALGARRSLVFGTSILLAGWAGLVAVARVEFASPVPARALAAGAIATAVSAATTLRAAADGGRAALLAHRRRYRLFFGLAGLVLLASLAARVFPGR